MRAFLLLITPLMMVGCEASVPTEREQQLSRDLETTRAQLDTARDELKARRTDPQASAPAAPIGGTAEQAAPLSATEEAAAETVEMCWQDYCPCEPPQGGMDEYLCRRLRAGLPVDEETMSAGVGFRDARQQMDDLERAYGPYGGAT